jgi:hypothetical protein
MLRLQLPCYETFHHWCNENVKAKLQNSERKKTDKYKENRSKAKRKKFAQSSKEEFWYKKEEKKKIEVSIFLVSNCINL